MSAMKPHAGAFRPFLLLAFLAVTLEALAALALPGPGADADLTGSVIAAPKREGLPLFEGEQPAVSPDGKTIAYRQWVDRNSEIYLAPLSGGLASGITSTSGTDPRTPARLSSSRVTGGPGSPRRFTNDPALDSSPAWSPDGRSLCFVSNRSENKDIWVAEVDHPDSPRQLTRNPGPDEEPAWSPDGSLIAYASIVEGRSDLFVVPAGGGEPVRLTNDRFDDSHPTWSPDGRRIAFVSDRQDHRNIWMLDFGAISEKGRGPVDPSVSGLPHHFYQLTSGSFDDSDPVWCPASDIIAFSSDRMSTLPLIPGEAGAGRPGTRRLFLVSTGPRPLLRLVQDGPGILEQPAWMPGGHDLVYVFRPLPARGDEGHSTLWLLVGARGGD